MTQKRIIYLLRHGESETNRLRVFTGRALDPPLTSEGLAMAELQAQSLAKAGIRSIFSSPLLRARQTAEAVAKRCSLDIRYSDLIKEVDVGSLNGLSLDDPKNYSIYTASIKKWVGGQSDYAIPGGESLEDVKSRFGKFLYTVLDNQVFAPILLVGHGILWMCVLWTFCGQPGELIDSYYMGRAHLTKTKFDGKKLCLLRFNIAPGNL